MDQGGQGKQGKARPRRPIKPTFCYGWRLIKLSFCYTCIISSIFPMLLELDYAVFLADLAWQ